jgi:hypothetical protein
MQHMVLEIAELGVWFFRTSQVRFVVVQEQIAPTVGVRATQQQKSVHRQPMMSPRASGSDDQAMQNTHVPSSSLKEPTGDPIPSPDGSWNRKIAGWLNH